MMRVLVATLAVAWQAPSHAGPSKPTRETDPMVVGSGDAALKQMAGDAASQVTRALAPPRGTVYAYTNEQGEVSMLDPVSGTYRWVPREQAAAAAKAGLIPETREQYYARQAERRSHENTVLAAVVVSCVALCCVILGFRYLRRRRATK